METQSGAGNSSGKLIAGAILIAAVIIAGALFYQPGTRPAAAVKVDNTPAVSVDDDAVLGSADAPVTIVIFGDYQCPFCKKAYNEAEAKIRTEYVATGKVKMVFRDFPLDSIHPSARPASEAAQCAADQGKYWEYHDALFDKQEQLPTLDYVSLAAQLGLNTGDFSTCVANKTYAAEVQKDQDDGIALGVSGTPASFINGELISGAYPYETYRIAIEKALRAAK